MSYKIEVILEREYAEVFGLILRKDSNWRAKPLDEKLEVLNLVRKEMYLPPVDPDKSIIKTFEEMEIQRVYLKVLSGSVV